MRIFVALALLLTTGVAYADTYYARPATGGSTPEQLNAINELVLDTLVSLPDVDIVENEGSAEFVLEPKLLKLETSYIVTITKLRAGKVVYRQKARAANFDDIDTVVKRATRATVGGVRTEKDVRVSDVMVDEVTRGKKRIETVNQHYVGMGPGGGINLNATGKPGVNLLIGHSWGLNDQTGLNLFFQGMPFRESDSFLVHAGIGVEYHFSDANHSPFVLGAMGYGAAGLDEKAVAPSAKRHNDGFTASIGGGYKFFRASTVNMGVLIQYTQMTTPNAQGLPSAVTGSVILYIPGRPQSIPVLGGMF